MKSRFFILLFLWSLVGYSFANNTINVDSLKAELQQTTNDSIKYDICVDLGIHYEYIDFSIAKQYYDQSKEIALANKWYKKVGDSYFNKSFYYHYSLQSDTAFQMLDEALKWYIKADHQIGVLSYYFTVGTYQMNLEEFDSATVYLEKAVAYGDTAALNDSIYLDKSYNNLGLLYQYRGFLDLAIENFIVAAKLREERNSPDIFSTYINLGLSYSSTNQKEESILYYKKALKITHERKDLSSESLCLNNIGEVYSTDSNSTYVDSAFYYYDQAYTIFETLGDSNSMARSHNSKAAIYQRQHKYDRAIQEYEKALDMIPSNGLKRLQISVINNYTTLRLELPNNTKKDYREIIQLAEKSYRLSKETGLIQNRSIAAMILFQAYSENKQFEKAYPFGAEHIELSDSLKNQARTDALVEQQTKFETEKKELEIDLLNKENELISSQIKQNNIVNSKQQLIIYLLVGGVITIAIFLSITLRFYRTQQKSNEELEKSNKTILKQKEEKDVLLKEIHHRVKNNLQIIWSLLDLQSNSIKDAYVKEAINDGKNRVNSMATIHQMLYQNDDAGNISFEEYIRKLTQQILSTHSHAKNIDLDIQIPKDLKFDIDTSIPLGLIVTELFTNSLKYGTDSKNGRISITLKHQNNDHYTLLIKDNGSGLPEGFEIKKSKSLGLRLVKNLCKQIKGEFLIQNDHGAEFMINFRGTFFNLGQHE
ncbi:tetratricopeptide repeat protein [bacterium SCSIO 12643]|nr:tetratricopeptide repeat protein [bacterium SCSIO 12643]